MSTPPPTHDLREAVARCIGAVEMSNGDDLAPGPLRDWIPDGTPGVTDWNNLLAVADALLAPAGPIASELSTLMAEHDALAHRRRWNVMEGEAGSVLVCHHAHEKSEDCDWVEYVPASRVDTLKAAAARDAEERVRLKTALSKIRDFPENYDKGGQSWKVGYAFHCVTNIARAAFNPEKTDG